ncbi:MAG: hypothetical protein K8W52_06565 [Deltaproteobacteria bacterium]|nr:hypothetical protein [Deltaproteobacteria bacterium]
MRLVFASAALAIAACSGRAEPARIAAPAAAPIVIDAAALPPDAAPERITAAPADDPADGGRVLAVAPDDPMRGYWEHDELPDACAVDADCGIEHLGYACLARPGPPLYDSFDDLPMPPADASCGCVAGACAWWRSR